MNKIVKVVLMPLAFIVAIVGISGCEWSSGGDSSWTDAPDWVNFSGVYRGAGGAPLITDYTSSSQPGVNTVNPTTIGGGNGGSVYNGLSLGNNDIVPGTVSINAASYSFSDDGSGNLIGSVAGTSGTVNYATGAVAIDLGNLTLGAGQPIVASYQYNTGASSAQPGTTGITIYTFTVHQQGNTLTITDNNGSVYKGKFGSVETTTGEQGDSVSPDGEIVPATGTAVAQYSAEGVSAAGVKVTMTGTMQGQLGGAGGTFANRVMLGTWIEDPGRTGDIQGYAAPIAVAGGGPTTTN